MTDLRHVEDGVLLAMVDGEVASVPLAALHHVRDCLECRRRRAEMTRRSQILAAMFAEEDRAEPAAGDRTRRAAPELRAGPVRGWARDRRVGVAAAAAVIFLFAVLSPAGAALRDWFSPPEAPVQAPPQSASTAATAYTFDAPSSQLIVRVQAVDGGWSIRRGAGGTIRVSVERGDGTETVGYGGSELHLGDGGDTAVFTLTVPSGLVLRVFDEGTEVHPDEWPDTR